MPEYPSSVSVYEASGHGGALPPDIRPLAPDMHIFAPAFPVRFPPHDNRWWQWAVDAADRGEVLVVDVGEGIDVVHFEMALIRTAMSRKLAGLVVNAAVHEPHRLAEQGWPIFARGLGTPRTGHGPADGELGEPVVIGNIPIALGDLIVGDASGVVRRPTGGAGR
jgi:4-hydroxy-4-methyl-2-oxoglutarate aldolase